MSLWQPETERHLKTSVQPNVNTSAFPTKNPPIEPVKLGSLSERPLVSIVVPSWNQGEFIADTIDSILQQDYRPLQIHVIDGGSTDRTVKVLQSYGDVPELDWISEKDKGVVDAVNKGFAKVQGEVVAIQSSDDMYMPNAVATMVQALKERPEHGLLYADTQTVDAGGEFLSECKLLPFTMQRFLNKQTYIPQPSAFFRREMLDTCGGWDDRYFSADTQLWLRMAFRTKIEKVDACVAKRRAHDDQRNNQAAKIVDAYRRMVKDSPELKQAHQELRRAAQAGTHMHWIRYNPAKSHVLASYHLWRAVKLDPSLWPVARSSPLLIPGYLPVRIAGSRIKQWLFGNKRAHAS